MVVMIAEIVLRHVVGKLASGQRLLLHASIHACAVERKRIRRSEHTNVRKNRCIVLRMAIAIGRNVNDQRNVEARSSVHHGFRIFSHAAIQHLVRVIVFEANGIEIASAETSAATNAFFGIDRHFLGFFVENKSAVCALTQTKTATAAFGFFDKGLAAAVLFCFARTGTATHADILDRTSEAGHVMALEMGKTDEHVGIHNGSSDLCVLDIFTADNGNLDIVRTL